MRPWVVLTTIGKKQIRKVMIVTLFRPGPTQRMRIGAMHDDRRHLEDHEVGKEARAHQRGKGEDERKQEAQCNRRAESQQRAAARVERGGPEHGALFHERPGNLVR
jgi:hypothetical protein